VRPAHFPPPFDHDVLQAVVILDDLVADSDHEAMVAAAREHYVDHCENELGIPVTPKVRNAILEGTPVAVSEVIRLSVGEGRAEPSGSLGHSPPPSAKLLQSNIPRRRGFEHAAVFCVRPFSHLSPAGT
jgi:hypothetical protein